jgi:quinol monooxygenase YgiN
VDTQDEAHLLVIEKWESIEHDQAYRDWRATDAGASALSTIVASRSLTRFVAA